MNDFDMRLVSDATPQRALLPSPDHGIEPPPETASARRVRRRLLGLAVLLLLLGALGFGVWRHFEQHGEVMATAGQQASFVPTVRVEPVAARQGSLDVSLPGTTLAFQQADIYAHISGYVLKRHVDIGDRVKAGQLLAEITAPEIDYQIAQLQSSVQQAEATTRQK